MDDLAFFMMRTNLLYEGRFGDMNECAKRYSEYAGIELDRDRIEYYRPIVLMRWLIAASQLSTTGPTPTWRASRTSS